MIVSVGGDGTINEIINGIYQSESMNDVILGILNILNLSDITKEEPISSVAELIDIDEYLLEGEKNKLSYQWAYRGQPCDFGTLTPSFQRQFSRQAYGAAEVIE